MHTFTASLRLAVGALGAAAVVATFFDTASRERINPFNFFGFFTMQGNIFGAIVLLLTACVGFARLPRSRALELARACATTYLAIVGLVYNVLLAGLPGGVDLAWANTVLHVVVPIYVVVDWVAFADRRRLPWARFWFVLIYPLAWLIVVLIRGATDGWVPYPFLDPATGYQSVGGYAVAIAVGFGIIGVAVWACSRLALVSVPDAAPRR